jgi:hypothetical protein
MEMGGLFEAREDEAVKASVSGSRVGWLEMSLTDRDAQ